MYKRQISCVNTDDNTAINFNAIYGGFIIDTIDGIYEIAANLNTTEYGATDGSHYSSTVVPKRNIVITGRILSDYKKKRDMLYRVFRPGSSGRFEYTEEGETRVIDYRMERCTIEDPEDRSKIRAVEISLICPDPYFRGVQDVKVVMAAWLSQFEFPHQFLDGGEEFGVRSSSVMQTVTNENGVNGIGMTITIGATGPVTNPKLYHVEKGEFIAIGTDENPFSMDAQDQVVIETTTGKKRVHMIRNNVKTTIDEYLDPASEFIQLNTGENTLRYAADDGEVYMTVVIAYRMRYLGV